jgi:Fe-S-cluster-containing dehydrogenase component
MSTDETNSEDPAHPYETEDSFHPMGEEWEDQMREELEETDYDADLGMQMARDAQRLVAGEITEEEFYAEYHEDVDEEFDVDDRPVLDDLDIDDPSDLEDFEEGSMLSSLADIDLEADDVTRRDVMKKMGAGAAFLGYGAYASRDSTEPDPVPQDISGINPPDEDERQNRWGMVIDLERCDGCLACVAGCVDENATSTGANWMYVFPYENEDSEQQNFLVRPCQHCSNAPCAKVCPVRARHTRSKDGLVLTDYETCIGCRYCQVACPYGVNYFQWGDPDVPMDDLEHLEKTPSEVQSLSEEERQMQLSEANDHVYDHRGKWADSRPPQGVMGKCTMCPSRQDEHTDNPRGTVACQDACDSQGMSAIHFGDLDNPDSRPNEYLRQRSENQFEDGASHFEAELSFETGGESVDADPGSYPLYFIEQRVGQDRPWRLLDEEFVVVAEGDGFEASEMFAESTIGDLGGVPGTEAGVLTPNETTDVDVTLVFDDDEFDQEEYDVQNGQVDFDVELRLVGAEEATLDTATVTLDQEEDVVDRQIRSDVTLTADGLDVSEDEMYGLFLLVGGDSPRAATHQLVLVSDSGRVDRPQPPYEASRLDGGFQATPEVVFTGAAATFEAAIETPRRPRTHDMQLVLDDSSIETADDTGQSIVTREYEFTQPRTTNTPWEGKLSTFRLLENLGTEPNITYLGNEPGPHDEQNEGPVAYEDISSDNWSQWMEIKSERKEHLDYGAGARTRTGENP